jgi:hypothetical protein
MLVIRDHSARYTLQEPGGEIIGHITQGQLGWKYANATGQGPRHPRSTPAGALEYATVLSFLRPAPWREIVRVADQKYGHNESVARRDAR